MRSRLGIAQRPSPEDRDLEPFVHSLKLAHETTARSGRRASRVAAADVRGGGDASHGGRAPPRSPRGAILRPGWAITVIDGVALFQQQQDPASLYVMRIDNHPGPRGYDLLANRVLSELQERVSLQRETDPCVVILHDRRRTRPKNSEGIPQRVRKRDCFRRDTVRTQEPRWTSLKHS